MFKILYIYIFENHYFVLNARVLAGASAALAMGLGGIGGTAAAPFAYVTNYDSNSVSVIDTPTNKVVATIPGITGGYGVAVTPDGKYVYVTNWNSTTVSVIDTATNAMVGTPISVGTTPSRIAITPNGAYVYVSIEGAKTVSVLDTASNNVIATIPVGGVLTGAL